LAAKVLETGDVGEVFKKNVRQALRTAEPGFSFNFFEDENDTLRNACTEVVSSDDSDVCNLGSINLGRIESVKEFSDIVELATKFLICGTLRADLPYAKVYETREKNRRLGLGIMGLHEWLIQRGSTYEVTLNYTVGCLSTKVYPIRYLRNLLIVYRYPDL
jgi:ribonucleoside-diphosphate reductase alpha chain